MPDAQPKRRRRWLRRILAAMFLAVLAVVVVGVLAVQHLDWIAKWSIHRVFPGVKVELGSLRVVSASRLEVHQFTLRSSKTKELLLTLEGGTVVFSFGDIWRLRLDEVELQKPNLVVSPDLGEALGVKPAVAAAGGGGAGSGQSGSLLGWGINRVLITGGHLRLTKFGEQSPTVDMDISTDLRDFGVGGATGRIEHDLRVEKIAATDSRNREFLKIGTVDIRFTTEELFNGNKIRSARIGKGSLTVSPSLVDSFQSGTASSAPQAGAGVAPGPRPASSAPSGWSIGSLQLDGVHATILNAPGMIGKVEFHIAATLQNLGAVGSPLADAMQSVVVTDLWVSTDAEPKVALLSAEEAAVKFTIAGLAQRRIEELTLEEPDIDFAPAMLASQDSGPANASAPANASSSGPAPTWLIAHASCDYGTLRMRGLQGGAVDLTARLAFDLTNLGTLGDAAKAVHELTVWDVQASSGRAKAFISLDVARVQFTTSGLLDQQRIEAVKIDGGRVLVGQALQKLLAPPPAATPAPPSTASTTSGPPAAPGSSAGWSIGSLDISGVRTRIEDRRPGVPDLRFTLNTSLNNVSANSLTDQLLGDVQTVELANIDLRSPLNPAAKILSF
ncbi:MAG TPA: hypothetical protein VNB29_03190, partial [Chthoniobacterales bacterium]|nr:hypothetical protein [Chthoniobacterales bacterium]